MDLVIDKMWGTSLPDKYIDVNKYEKVQMPLLVFLLS